MTDTDNSQVDASLDDDEQEEETGGLTPQKILLLIIFPLLLVVGGAAAYFMGLIGGGTATQEVAAIEEDLSVEGDGAADPNAVFLKIPEMIVNLSSSDGQPRYLRLSVQLELKTEAEKESVQQVMPRVIDQFQTYLRELRVRDLRGSAGIYRLQMELLSRVNASAYPVEVQDVLFQEILIQ